MESTALAPDTGHILAKALLRAATALGLNQAQLGRAIGLDRSSVSRLRSRGTLAPESKQGELALLVIRIYRALFALTGGDGPAMTHWLHTDNDHLHGVPADLIATVQGIAAVAEYLDAIRGKV